MDYTVLFVSFVLIVVMAVIRQIALRIEMRSENYDSFKNFDGKYLEEIGVRKNPHLVRERLNRRRIIQSLLPTIFTLVSLAIPFGGMIVETHESVILFGFGLTVACMILMFARVVIGIVRARKAKSSEPLRRPTYIPL